MIVYKSQVSDDVVRQIVLDIKSKKELANVDDGIVSEQLVKLLKQNSRALNFLLESTNTKQLRRSESYKKIIKFVRAELRQYYGMFVVDSKKREELLEKLDGLDDLETHREILSTHESARERIGIYDKLYNDIFWITGKPDSILDLGCGMNPFSYPFMSVAAKYYASDISSKDTDFVQRYFRKVGIDGITFPLNLKGVAKAHVLDIFPKTDVCFLFKVLDSIETKGHKLAEILVKAINSDFVVASFSTRTLSGKRMRHPYRGWIEQMCKRIGYGYEVLEFENEIFYVINKQSKFMTAFGKGKNLQYS